MTARTSTALKLFLLCALLWVQALQVDHVTDQTVDSQHTDCVVCKSVGDAALTGSAPSLQNDHPYSNGLISGLTSQSIKTVAIDQHPARAPPFTS